MKRHLFQDLKFDLRSAEAVTSAFCGDDFEIAKPIAATVEQKEQLRSEGRTCRERQACSKASDVALTLSSASTACAALAVARAKVPPILGPFWLQNLVKLLPTFKN